MWAWKTIVIKITAMYENWKLYKLKLLIFTFTISLKFISDWYFVKHNFCQIGKTKVFHGSGKVSHVYTVRKLLIKFDRISQTFIKKNCQNLPKDLFCFSWKWPHLSQWNFHGKLSNNLQKNISDNFCKNEKNWKFHWKNKLSEKEKILKQTLADIWDYFYDFYDFDSVLRVKSHEKYFFISLLTGPLKNFTTRKKVIFWNAIDPLQLLSNSCEFS